MPEKTRFMRVSAAFESRFSPWAVGVPDVAGARKLSHRFCRPAEQARLDPAADRHEPTSIRYPVVNVRKTDEEDDMARSARNLGMLLLAIYLILSGLIQLISLHFAGLSLIMGLLAIVAGILLLLGR
jgi:hypothetical protein